MPQLLPFTREGLEVLPQLDLEPFFFKDIGKGGREAAAGEASAEAILDDLHGFASFQPVTVADLKFGESRFRLEQKIQRVLFSDGVVKPMLCLAAKLR